MALSTAFTSSVMGLRTPKLTSTHGTVAVMWPTAAFA
jgi:hypothetical protein